ncbi:MAG: metal ABC transporter substrate-binding protein [Brooklawnia sp.]|uniref:metal ABC transporter substrate-binding protein n=1 Tax=Brooklawnia sp. TaxID=2699740 RepID=UPI003C72004A
MLDPRPRFRTLAVLAGAAALLLSSCASQAQPGGADDHVAIVVGAYPFQFAAERVAGEHAEVTNLLAPGADSHGLELSPQQVATVTGADLVVHQSGYQPALDEVIAQQQPTRVLDTGDFVRLLPASGHGEAHEHSADDDHDHDHGGYDPHVWLDPTNLVRIGDQIAAQLAQADPGNADTYRANAADLAAELTELDEQFAAGLANCRTETFITNHAAFGYLADRYHLHQVAISGLSAEAEPSPARIAEVQQIARDHDLTTIFYETSVSPKLAEAIASDLGLQTDVLDPLETLAPDARGADYLEVMTANLDALRKANGCR